MSYILSSFYYSALENAVMKQIVFNSPLHVIMRMTDDYIMITDCVEDAYKFISALVRLSESGLIKFNKKKLKANFPIHMHDVVLEPSQLIQTGNHFFFMFFHTRLKKTRLLSMGWNCN